MKTSIVTLCVMKPLQPTSTGKYSAFPPASSDFSRRVYNGSSFHFIKSSTILILKIFIFSYSLAAGHRTLSSLRVPSMHQSPSLQFSEETVPVAFIDPLWLESLLWEPNGIFGRTMCEMLSLIEHYCYL